MKFNNVEITQETILATRQHFADIQQGCINEVLNGQVKLPSHTKQGDYFTWCKFNAQKFLSGQHDTTFTFLQRAFWIQTGEMIALLA